MSHYFSEQIETSSKIISKSRMISLVSTSKMGIYNNDGFREEYREGILTMMVFGKMKRRKKGVKNDERCKESWAKCKMLNVGSDF